MRCTCCDKALNDYESTIKHEETGDYLDTCMKCLDGLDIPFVARADLNPFDSQEEEDVYVIENSEE